MSKTTKVFVYGTLKQGQFFHSRLLGDSARSLGNGFADLDFSLYVDAFPMLVRESSDQSVKGELYEIPSELLSKIDGIEGPGRDLISVLDDGGNRHNAWAYLFPVTAKQKRGAVKEYEWS